MIYIHCLQYRARITSKSSCLHLTGEFLRTRKNKKYSACIAGNMAALGRYLGVGPKLKSYMTFRNEYYKYEGQV